MTHALDELADLVHRETGIRLAGHQHPFLQARSTGSKPARARRRSRAAWPIRAAARGCSRG